MTKDQAIAVAVRWWQSMILLGVWDNGDAKTERTVDFFRALTHEPTAEDMDKCRPFFEKLMTEKIERAPTLASEVYSDYGSYEIDAVFQAAGVKLRSGLHAPQKAGTRFFVDEQGSYTVKAKHGYGQEYVEIR